MTFVSVLHIYRTAPAVAFSYPHFDLATSSSVLSQTSKGLSTSCFSIQFTQQLRSTPKLIPLLPFTVKILDFFSSISKTNQIFDTLSIPPSLFPVGKLKSTHTLWAIIPQAIL